MVVEIPFVQSPALAAEVQALREWLKAESSQLERYATAAAYTHDYSIKPEGMEVQRFFDELPRGQRVLDIGVGRGESSIHLAAQGHRVTAVEPTRENCELIDASAKRFGLDLKIVHCTAEGLVRLEDRFDVVLFNACLHHCDEPVTALRNAFNLLVPGGRLLVVNEPFLHFFRSKAWYYRRLETHPQEMGHYGGNEHTYRYGEYVAMIREAGFPKPEARLNLRNTDVAAVVRQLEERRIQGQQVYDSRRVLVRKAYFTLVSQLARRRVSRPVISAMKHLSLLAVSFVAVKP